MSAARSTLATSPACRSSSSGELTASVAPPLAEPNYLLSICDTSASVFGRLFGKWTGALPFSGSLFGAKKSVAGTISAVITGALASYIFWSRYATRGDEGDLSWLPAKLLSEWKDPVSVQPTFLPRLPSPQSTLGLVPLALLNGAVAGVAEVSSFFLSLLYVQDGLLTGWTCGFISGVRHPRAGRQSHAPDHFRLRSVVDYVECVLSPDLSSHCYSPSSHVQSWAKVFLLNLFSCHRTPT